MRHDTKNFEINAVCSVQQSKNNLKLEITQRRSLEKPNSRKSNALGVIIIICAWMEICTPLNSWKRGMKASDTESSTVL